MTSLQVHAMLTIHVNHFPPLQRAVTKLFSFQMRVICTLYFVYCNGEV